MGKKNKKESAAKSANRWRTGQLNKKERQAMERFGLDTNDYGFDGGRAAEMRGGRDVKDYNQMQEDFKRAARNDYDLRRTMEAAAMSGKGKAQKILDDGFKSPGDVMNAANFSRKAAEKRGVKSFTSNADYMGLTQSMVERDRRKFNEDIDRRIGNAIPEEAPVDKIEKDMNEQTELSETAKNAIKFGDDMSYDPTAGIESEEAGKFLDDYKFKSMQQEEDEDLIISRGPGERTSAILGTAAGGLN